MKRKNWKQTQPTSLRHALELCKDYARERHNISVERIAERMGLADHWTIYKWIQNGTLPSVRIRSYENACGIDFVTRWLAISADKMLIDIPSGRNISSISIQSTQEALNSAVGALLRFSSGNEEANETISNIQNAMEELAYHRENIKKHSEPEFEFGRLEK